MACLVRPEDAWLRDYESLRHALRRVVAPSLGADEVDDVLGEAFLCFLERSSKSQEIQSPRFYLLSIVRHLVYREIRRRARQRLVFSSLEFDPEELAGSASTRASAALRELGALLEGMNEVDRRALVLRKVEGLELEEIAEALGISRSTTQRHVASATLFLRRRASRSALLAEFVPVPTPGSVAEPTTEAAE